MTSGDSGNGSNEMQDICGHPFFANLSWHRLETKRVTPPIIPSWLANWTRPISKTNSLRSTLRVISCMMRRKSAQRLLQGRKPVRFQWL
ncbi:hypothetical protein PsorP6_009892 [Peronosclerospora sorghi]|uniref:Uncharacterized protein n=1 Tax=Peronosclerospora sorghi TaxID=230839 RepID=A0ACC0VYJ5_9STRA|nr:hypothetical protein PsorP6_009892 [Peronosclerospora sorghi]